MRKTGNYSFRRANTKQRRPSPMADARRPDADGETVRTSFGEHFRACRKKLQLSPGVIHELTGVPASHIAQIEAGQGSLHIDTMVKLAAIVQMPLWQLLKPRRRNRDGGT